MSAIKPERQHPRVELETSVAVQFAGEEDFEVRTVNLSAGGMFLRSKSPRPVGSAIRFAMELDGDRIAGDAEVTWIRPQSQGPTAPSGMGARFRYLNGDGRQSLDKCLTAHSAA